MGTGLDAAQLILVGAARIALENVQLREDILLDELHLEGGDIRIEPPVGEMDARITTGETRIRAMMSEANLNRLVTANLPSDAPVRSLHIALLSGRARISGKALVSIVPFPFSIEATPRVENGVRVLLDCRTATLGVDMPRAVVDVLETRINEALGLDVSALEIPIWIDEIKCEPGRLTAIGRARIAWPPQAAIAAAHQTAIAAAPSERLKPVVSSGFTVSNRPLFGETQSSRRALTTAPRLAPGDDAATVA